MNDDKLHILLKKYLANTLHTEELEEFVRLLREADNLDTYENLLKETWDDTQRFKDSTTLPGIIRVDNVMARIQAKQKVKPLPLYKALIAASVLIGVLAFSYLKFEMSFLNFGNSSNQLTVITSDYGQKKKVLLPDSTLVFLNSGSELSYNKQFNEKDREVFLKGEAFFDVKKNTEKPFIVTTDSLYVQVLGTSFNVNAFADNKEVAVMVKTGLVDVGSFSPSRNERMSFRKLSPNERLTYNLSSKKMVVSQEEYTNAIYGWKDQILAFDSMTFEEIARRIERWYGYSIGFKQSELKTYKFTGEFEKLTLSEVLDIMQMTKAFKYEIKEKTILIETEN